MLSSKSVTFRLHLQLLTRPPHRSGRATLLRKSSLLTLAFLGDQEKVLELLSPRMIGIFHKDAAQLHAHP
jgi:hypothetical protein